MLCVGHHLKEGIHILLDHLEDFFDDMERTLKDTSDEHLHPYLNKHFVHSIYLVKHINNPSQGSKLY